MRLLILILATGACNWTTFDDLADTTWVHSQQAPNVGSTDYAAAIVGATAGSTSGELAVVSDDSPSYTTLIYDAKGGTSVGPDPQKLGNHFIASLSAQPILVGDGNGNIALVEAAIDAGQIAVVTGPADNVGDRPFASASGPSAAVFAGTTLVIGAGSNLVLVDAASAKTCAAVVTGTTAIAGVAALGADDTRVWVWTTDGLLLGYPIATLASTCMPVIPPAVPPTSPVPVNVLTTTGFSPGANAKLHVIGTSASTPEIAILAANGAGASTTAGEVVVVNLTTPGQIGTTLMVDGLASSAVGVFGGTTYLALGFPQNQVGGVTTGQVELHALDDTTHEVAMDSAETLNDAQPDADEEFGRDVAAMTFDGQPILVVAAKSEIFSYYETLLYNVAR